MSQRSAEGSGPSAIRSRALLDGRRTPLAAELSDPAVPLVVLDLASVESYFLVQPLACLAFEQDGARWCPLLSPPEPLDLDRRMAEHTARALELELCWPERHPTPVPKAKRVATLACLQGCGADFMLRMFRLAWCSGRDLDNPREYEFVASELGLDAVIATSGAQQGSAWELAQLELAMQLQQIGIGAAPTVRWGGEVHRGRPTIEPLLAQSPSLQSRLT